MSCIECLSQNTKWFKGDDGHSRKECLDCGLVWGPFISKHILDELDSEIKDEDESSQDTDSIFDY